MTNVRMRLLSATRICHLRREVAMMNTEKTDIIELTIPELLEIVNKK